MKLALDSCLVVEWNLTTTQVLFVIYFDFMNIIDYPAQYQYLQPPLNDQAKTLPYSMIYHYCSFPIIC